MARPKSEDKRKAILNAAAQAIAEQGLGAPTARIAKLAGVAEGTLFTYFSTKDVLLNELYLEIKAELSAEMTSSYPRADTLKARAAHAWHRYVDWGMAHPHQRKVMAQLGMSERVTDETRGQGMQAFTAINQDIQESAARGALSGQPLAFVGAIMTSLAETTMEFMSRDPSLAKAYAESGFEAFWNAMTSR
jgi:AcrR family transcriptional regulator